MTIVIAAILLIGYLLIATERYTNINKAAVAIFVGTLGWILYICYGADFVTSQHLTDFSAFLNGIGASSSLVKQFIAHDVFLKYVGKASEIVLFLLATTTIVEILQNNGCFDFLTRMLRTRNSRKMLWMLSTITFVVSANLDNLTTTVMMLTVMHGVVANQRQRLVLGCAVVVSANCGGALTVIGDPTGLVLWNTGAVTASNFSASLAIPCLVAWLVPVAALGQMMPGRIETVWATPPYQGDDTVLKVWQRTLMLFVGIGGLWFIPTFHNITKLSPFLGALCVLAVLWIVNEVANRKRMATNEMVRRRTPLALQYGGVQTILFVLGIMLTVGVIRETGVAHAVMKAAGPYLDNLLIAGTVTGLASTVLDNFATAATMISLHGTAFNGGMADIASATIHANDVNDAYWKVVAYASAMGGNVFSIGSASGLALMKIERMRFGMFFRIVGWKALAASAAGLAILCITLN